jgi:putative transposase
VTPANTSDTEGGKRLLEPIYRNFTRMKKLWLDEGYRESCIEWIQNVARWEIEKIFLKEGINGAWKIQGKESKLEKPVKTGFVVKPKRWVVERTFGWLGRYRRLSKDYEAKCDTEEAWVWIAMSRILLYRLDTT